MSWGMSTQLKCFRDVVLQASQVFWGSATHRAAWHFSEALGCSQSAQASAHVLLGPVSAHFCCDPLRPAAFVGLRPGNFSPCSGGRTKYKINKVCKWHLSVNTHMKIKSHIKMLWFLKVNANYYHSCFCDVCSFTSEMFEHHSQIQSDFQKAS